MAFLVFYDGLLDDLQAILDDQLEGCSVGLFTSNHTPALTDTLSTYTAIEAAWTGYARQTASGWSTPNIDGSDQAVSYSPLLSYTVTAVSGVTVYGYFVIDQAGNLHHAELISPTIVPVTGTPVSLLLRYLVKNP